MSQISQSQQTKPKEVFKGIRFCSECDNMLEAMEYRQDDLRYLRFECNLCNTYQKAAEGSEVDNCVYRTDFSMRAENLIVDPECIKDPTLSRRKDVECKYCGHNEAVTFTQPTKTKLNLIFVCTRCTQHWSKGEGAKDENEEFSDKE